MQDNAITLHAGSPVTGIDRAARVVMSEAGVKAHYDVLLIATGSRAFIPPIDRVCATSNGELLKPGVFGFRTIDDCTQGSWSTAKPGRASVAAVIGGGLLGLEAARGLLNAWVRRDMSSIWAST